MKFRWMPPGIILLPPLALLLVALHLPYLTLPFHWDELGQFVPASLDLYRDGAWVTHSTEPNVHPPGVMAILAGVWKVTGYSILVSRLTMLMLAALGVYLSFLLAVHLSRGTPGAPAFAATAFLIAAPMFYTQSMMVLLDMPAMTFTVLALLLFYGQRYFACALACTALVLVKETALTAPMVFGAWLLFMDRRIRQALYFILPAAALGLWLVYLRQVTGSWFGNEEFVRYNVAESVTGVHVAYAVLRRIYTLFLADGHWIGTIALFSAWPMLRSRDWQVAWAVVLAQVAAVTLLGGAVLDRYLLPVLPVLYTAFAIGISAWSQPRKVVASAGFVALLVAGWFINPPYPFSVENNLSVVDFIKLQQAAAEYIETELPEPRVASVWPFTAAIRNPAFGYVRTRIPTLRMQGLHLADFEKLPLTQRDVLAVYSRGHAPPEWLLQNPTLRGWMEPFIDLQPEATSAELQTLGYVSRARWQRRGQWFALYTRAELP